MVKKNGSGETGASGEGRDREPCREVVPSDLKPGRLRIFDRSETGITKVGRRQK